jgi:chemotaxis methyl-accepting protein methylase
MTSLDVENDVRSKALNEWLASIEARFSVQIQSFRQDAFEEALTRYAASIGESLGSLAEQARKGMLEQDHWSMVLHLATNHETKFFRSPAAIQQILNIFRGTKKPKLLSVGCSTGEEPYSIATALLSAGHGCFEIHGTDISAVCIKTAKLGIYKQHPEITSLAAAAMPSQKMRFHAWVRAMVTFEHHNILHERPVQMHRPNVIITQNMLIYYREQTRYEILDRLASMLDIGGYLITAPAETLNWCSTAMTRVQNSQLNVFVRSS